MFQTLTQKFSKIFDKIKGSGLLTEEDIDLTMHDIRIALIEADVALPVVKAFILEVSQKAKGVEVIKSLSPAQMVIKIINYEMIRLLEPDKNESKINLQNNLPVNLLVVGLQGSGKTTATVKLALKLKTQKKKVLVVSLDTYRPGAQDQLKILAESVGIDSFPIIREERSPITITQRSIDSTKLLGYDVVIYDTAGRLHIDKTMINEVMKIKQLIKPTETFLVMDTMIGQDSINVASNFNSSLDITGIILSRIDADSRGGAALSVRYITGKPIKFLSTGEKPSDFEEFDAKRIASRILDMGDIVSLVEKATKLFDPDTSSKNNDNKFKNGLFDLDDYISQIKKIGKMGGVTKLVSFLPGMSNLSSKLTTLTSKEESFTNHIAIVSSMTKKERKNPNLLNASRKRRIASGSGTSVQEINAFLKQFKSASNMIKKVSKMDSKTLFREGIRKLFP